MKEFLSLIFREDSFNHLSGSFFGVWLWHCIVTSPLWAGLMAFLCGIIVEEFQWIFGAHYPLKKWDTVKDILFDIAGIALAVLAIRGK